MKQMKVRMTGTSPILMHNERLANPLDVIAKQMKQVTGKRKKTDEDYARIAELEFAGGLYHDEKMGPYLPDKCLKAMILDGAKKHRGGVKVSESLTISETKVKLEYKGPRDIKAMWDAGMYDVRGVGVGPSRVMRCRPMFFPWSATVVVAFDENVINDEDLRLWIQTAGRQTGFMDHRPEFGKFDPEFIQG